MADLTWTGSAAPVAQVSTITIANTWATSDTLKFTIGDKSLTVTVGATTTTAAVATALKEAINGDAITGDATRDKTGEDWGELLEMVVAATDASSVVTLTAGTAGIPFEFSTTATTAGSGTSTDATPTAATGPNFYDNVENWDTGAAPTTGDNSRFKNSSVSCKYGLGSGDGASMVVEATYTGQIGLPRINTATSATFYEYRTTALDFSAASSTVDLGVGEGDGSGLIKVNMDGSGGTCRVWSTATRAVTGEASVFLSGISNGETIRVYSGDVELNNISGGSQTIDVGYKSTQATDATVVLGDLHGTLQTLPTLNVNGGTVHCYFNATTLNAYGGTVNTYQGSTSTTQNLFGDATLYDRSNGTITTVNIYGDDVTLDYDRGAGAKAVTTINKYTVGSTVKDNSKRISTLKVVGSTQNIEWGNNSTLTRS